MKHVTKCVSRLLATGRWLSRLKRGLNAQYVHMILFKRRRLIWRVHVRLSLLLKAPAVMPKSPERPLLLALHEMPMEATASVLALAKARGWTLRCEERVPPRAGIGEVLVAMAPVWAHLAAVRSGLRPKGLCLLATGSADADADAAALMANDIADRVQAWPCDASVLLAHLLALMAPSVVHLDAASRTARYRGQLVHLTPKECRILEVLLSHAGEAVAREQLEATLHAWGQEFESNTLDVHVHRLRRKLPDAGIRAVRGYGYVVMAQG